MRAAPAGPPAAEIRPNPGGIGRSASPEAERASDALRRYDSDLLRRRRRIAGLSLAAVGSLGVVASYQFGILKHVPEPPLPLLDADRVDASGEAYQYLRTPDAALGIASYGLTLVLAGRHAGRPSEHPLFSLLLAAKVAVDAVGGIYLTLEQGTKHRRFCSWCLAAAVTSLAAVPQMLPEARMAWRTLRSR